MSISAISIPTSTPATTSSGAKRVVKSAKRPLAAAAAPATESGAASEGRKGVAAIGAKVSSATRSSTESAAPAPAPSKKPTSTTKPKQSATQGETPPATPSSASATPRPTKPAQDSTGADGAGNAGDKGGSGSRSGIDGATLLAGKKGSDSSSETARATLDRVETYFRERFGRDGFNDAGGTVEVEIDNGAFGAHARVSRDPDATTGSIVVGRLPVGDSGMRRSVAGEVDILAHEYAHLVVANEIAGRATYDTVAGKNEHHAIQEGIADVFGAAIEQSWDLGSGYRDHAADHVEHGDDEIEHARDVDPEDVDPHEWGALLVDGAVTLQEQAGWEALEQAFYDVVQDDRLTERTSMRQVASWVVTAAYEHGGADAARAVRAAYAVNGVLPVTPPRNVI